MILDELFEDNNPQVLQSVTESVNFVPDESNFNRWFIMQNGTKIGSISRVRDNANKPCYEITCPKYKGQRGHTKFIYAKDAVRRQLSEARADRPLPTTDLKVGQRVVVDLRKENYPGGHKTRTGIVKRIGEKGVHVIPDDGGEIEWHPYKIVSAAVDECAGVGTITAQNSTVDVNKKTPQKNLDAFKL